MATATIDTYNDVLTKAAYMVGETVADTGTIRATWLKNTLQDISNRRRWKWLLTTAPTIPLVTATQTYNLPTDWVEDAAFEVKVTDTAGNDTIYYPIFEWQAPQYKKSSAGAPPVYYTRGNKADGYTITLLPTVTAAMNGHSLIIKYTKIITDYNSLADKVALPDSSALVLGVAKEIFRSQNRLDQYDLTRGEYEVAIGELEKTDAELERALLYSMPPTQQFYGTPSDVGTIYDNQ